jgi:hypothetical protein
MTKRIKELMAQSGFDPASIERMGVMPQAEKFAELIVKECCNEITQEPFNAGAASVWLQKHFGIEE